jgi:hypothetical protein
MIAKTLTLHRYFSWGSTSVYILIYFLVHWMMNWPFGLNSSPCNVENPESCVTPMLGLTDSILNIWGLTIYFIAIKSLLKESKILGNVKTSVLKILVICKVTGLALHFSFSYAGDQADSLVKDKQVSGLPLSYIPSLITTLSQNFPFCNCISGLCIKSWR